MKASLAIQVLPSAQTEDDMLRVVDEVIEMIQQTGLSYVVGPFETTVEADNINDLIDIIKNSQAILNKKGMAAATYMKLFIGGCADILTIDEKIKKYQV